MNRQVITPKDNDVIKGRGNGANLHPGNIRFRELIKAAREGYALSSKADKKQYTNWIVQHISNLDPPGRFLDKDKDGRWFVMDDRKAKDKTSQALREGAPAIVKAHNDKFKKILEEPIFLDISSFATNNTIEYPNGMNDGDIMSTPHSVESPSLVTTYRANSISKSSALTNQISTCDFKGPDTGTSSGADKCGHEVDSLSDSSLADFGYDDNDSDEKPPAKICRTK